MLKNNTTFVKKQQQSHGRIAEALKVNPVLTKLNLQYNSTMGDAGKQAVRDAVKDRSGFVLEL